MRIPAVPFLRLLACLGSLLALPATAAPFVFNLPAQNAAAALLAFSQQTRLEVLYSYDELHTCTSTPVIGQYEAEDALNRLLHQTGFSARKNTAGKFVVTRSAPPTGGLTGRFLTPAGTPARGITVALVDCRLRDQTDAAGVFSFPAVPAGRHRLVAAGRGYRRFEQAEATVEAGRTRDLGPLQLEVATEVTVLEPYLVEGKGDQLPIGEATGAAPRQAAGNLDLPRTADNALPFAIFTREQIARSGVVQLNEFFQRELLDGDSNSPPPEQNGNQASFVTGSSNLSLRGYSANETVVLVNGRRLPETITGITGELGPPDVNLIPLALVQQVEVLPVSASALYSGNAVGGVINIVLRPDAEGTEVRTTYTNALGGFDAPQSSVSLQHGRTLLAGRLKLRLNATVTRTAPPVESELGYQRKRLAATAGGLAPRATPNIVSADSSPLFGPGSSSKTSVAPGADGAGGLAAFAGREGVTSNGPFDPPGGLAASFNSLDYPYGRKQRRASYYGSAAYDLFPWLQLGLDASYSQSVVNRGYDVFAQTLTLPAASSLNPFGRDVLVSLNETATRLGADYSEARLDSSSVVLGALLRLPADWRVTFDAQYARNVARYRGLVRADADRWQQLVDEGRYQPLRDTQVSGPPAAFYDRVLVYYGGPGRFATLGDYFTLEGAARVSNEALPLPMGPGTINAGVDYRLSRLAPYTEAPRFADGTPAGEIVHWSGRTLERISAFGEVQAPLLPAASLPRWIRSIETDSSVRYVMSAQSNETNLAPTFGLKLDLAGGFSLRGSYTTSNRQPTPIMSRPLGDGAGGGSGSDTTLIFDPLRNERYDVESKIAINPNLRPEAAATQTAGLVYQHGRTHRIRASLDFADTTKTNEFIALDPQAVLNLESLFPDRVIRTTPATGLPARVTTVLTGAVNVARRHSQNWSAAMDYAWEGFHGGTLSLRGRWVWYQRYDRQVFPNSPVVDELGAPDGTAPGLLRNRLNFSAGWSGRIFGFGVDGHYLSSRTLPAVEWAGQGSDHIKSYWQFDAFVQHDLTRWLPWPGRNRSLDVQLRVNNLSGFAFPKYANDSSGSGVQPYGDWRGRTVSLSLRAEF